MTQTVATYPTIYLRNFSPCSCWLVVTSTCLCWGYSIPPRPNCRNHHLLPPRRGDHSPHTHLKSRAQMVRRGLTHPTQHVTRHVLIHSQADTSSSIFITFLQYLTSVALQTTQITATKHHKNASCGYLHFFDTYSCLLLASRCLFLDHRLPHSSLLRDHRVPR